MIKFAVCDDEPEMAQALCAALTAYMQARRADGCCVRSFSDGRSLLECGDSFDVILLDIQMSHPDGMETARQLRRRGERSLLVFVTVLEACVFDAFEVDACGYLLKPLDPGRFERTMNRVVKRLEERSAQTIVVQRGAACQVIALSEIVYCEVMGRKLYLHKIDGAVVEYCDRLERLERLPDLA